MANWRKISDSKNLPDVSGQTFFRELFYNCRFENVRNATFNQCCLLNSKFDARNLADVLGVTMSLDCFTFSGLEFNDAAFSGIVQLLSMTKGNDEKRAILRRLASEKIVKEHDDLMQSHQDLTMLQCRRGLLRL